MIVGYIYKIYNNINNYVYIGSSIEDLDKTWKYHENKAHDGNKMPLYKDMRLYGVINYKIQILYVYYCYDKNLLDKILLIQKNSFIKEYDSLENGYNELNENSVKYEYCNNDKKAKKHNVVGKNTSRKCLEKPICMYTLYGKYINTYPSARKCAIENNLNENRIGDVCNNKRTHHKNFYFEFLNEDNEHDICLNIIYSNFAQTHYFHIIEYDEHGNFIKQWENSDEIINYLGVKEKSRLINSCKTGVLYKNHKWEFVLPSWY